MTLVKIITKTPKLNELGRRVEDIENGLGSAIPVCERSNYETLKVPEDEATKISQRRYAVQSQGKLFDPIELVQNLYKKYAGK